VISGEFPQLSTRVKHSAGDKPQTTSIHYAGTFSLPMQKGSHSQQIRDGQVVRVRAHWDHTELDFDGASISINVDEEKERTSVATSYQGTWQPPFCEVGLRDALAFVSANSLHPRVTIRGFEHDALVFVRRTPEDSRTGMPRPVGAIPTSALAFWNIFIAFLRYCDGFASRSEQAFYSTPLARLSLELIPASTGTIHGFILSLVVAIEALVAEIIEPRSAVEIPADFIEHIKGWNGDEGLKQRAIKILNTFLPQISSNQNLRELVGQRVVTEQQRRLWDRLRQRVAHGKLVDYDDEKLYEKRLTLVTMFYRLALGLLGYQGLLTDYGTYPPQDFEFRWDFQSSATAL
jgi:hypothetical protein